MAALVRLVVDRVHEQEGEAGEHIVLTHPAGWGPYRQGRLFDALRDAGLDDIELVPAVLAAAETRPALSGPVAGFDLGGSTCTAFVVARTGRRALELLAYEERPVGGADLDDALVAHVRTAVGWDSKDVAADPELHSAMAMLRRHCTSGRERLSAATETLVAIPWLMPEAGQTLHALHSGQQELLVTRAELDELIRPVLRAAVETLAQLVSAGDRDPADLAGIMLVGGAARTPLVAALVAARLPGTVLVDHDPQTTVARGAAMTACRVGGRR